MNKYSEHLQLPSLNVLFISIFLLLVFFSLAIKKVSASISTNPDDYIVSIIEDGVNGVDMINNVQDIEVVGNYLYTVSNDDESLTIFDVSVPSAPVQVGIVDTPLPDTRMRHADSLFVLGDYAYVLANNTSSADSNLNIIDVSDKSDPTILSTIAVDKTDAISANSDIFVAGNYAYVSSIDDTLSIIDISNPSSPSLTAKIEHGVNGFTNFRNPEDIYVSGNYLYVTIQGIDQYVQIIDISNPASPSHVATIDPDIPVGGYLGDIKFENNKLYVLMHGGTDIFIKVYDVSTPSSPIFLNDFERSDFSLSNQPSIEMALKNDLIYITRGGGTHGSLVILNIKDVMNPVLVTSLDYDGATGWQTLARAYRVSLSDNNVYISTLASYDKILVLGSPESKAPNVYDANLFPAKVSSTYGADFAHVGDSTTLTGAIPIPIDTSKSYKIKGEFRGKDNTTQSRVYLGFAEYDKNRVLISSERVQRISPTTDAITFSSISSDRITLTFTGNVPSSWCDNSSDTYYDGSTKSCSALQERSLAIYLDGNLSKLPDFLVPYTLTSTNTIALTSALPEIAVGALNSSTKFLNHGRSATYNYAGANYQLVGSSWTSFESGLITSEDMMASDFSKFRQGTKYLKPIVLANFGQTGLGTELYMRNISVVEVDAYGNETPVNIPTITNQNVQPKFQCDDANTILVMTAGTNLSTISAEGTYTVSGYCQNPISAEKKTRSITFQIDKTAPSAPTWDAISSGTYSTGQSVFVTPSSNHSIVFYGAANSQTITYQPYIDGITLTSDGGTNRTYQINVRQYDPAGNLSSATSTRSYTITP